MRNDRPVVLSVFTSLDNMLMRLMLYLKVHLERRSSSQEIRLKCR